MIRWTLRWPRPVLQFSILCSIPDFQFFVLSIPENTLQNTEWNRKSNTELRMEIKNAELRIARTKKWELRIKNREWREQKIENREWSRESRIALLGHELGSNLFQAYWPHALVALNYV